MSEYEVTCPVCGNTVPFARVCRKCRADLSSVQKPDGQGNPSEPTETGKLQVSLERSESPTEGEMLALIDDPFWKARSRNRLFSLKVSDPSGKYPDRTILLADMGKTPGGITLAEWKTTPDDNGRDILSVYLHVSMSGHELDQWIHYDLMTGKELGRSVDDSTPPTAKMVDSGI